MNEEATAAYEAAITPEVARYLHGRGLAQETATGARLGVVADPLPGHGPYTGMLAIPYLGHDGRVLQIRFRCLSDHDHKSLPHGKYNTISGDPARLYNVQAIHAPGTEIHVTEGELDALVLKQAGFNAVAVPGANSWKGYHRRMLAGFSRIYVWGDPDDAGAQMVNKVTRSLRQARGVRLREGDVNETYVMHGAEHLRELVEAA